MAIQKAQEEAQEFVQKSKEFPEWFESTKAHIDSFKKVGSIPKTKGPKFVPIPILDQD